VVKEHTVRKTAGLKTSGGTKSSARLPSKARKVNKLINLAVRISIVVKTFSNFLGGAKTLVDLRRRV
jgi:hypothetical protein